MSARPGDEAPMRAAEARPPNDAFVEITAGRDRMLLRDEVRGDLERLLPALLDGARLPDERALRGGRGTTLSVSLATGGRAVLRRNLRGGWPARFVRDLYLGVSPRPFAEVRATERLRRAGVAVPEPLGAIARRSGPLVYRGAVATREIENSANLWEYLLGESSIERRRSACAAAVALVDRLLAAGAFHPDLNLRNFLVTDGGQRLWLVDCDRVRFGRTGAGHRRRALSRLLRSARRLDRDGRIVEPGWFDGRTAG